MSRKDPNKPRGRTTAYAYFVIAEKEAFYRVWGVVKLNLINWKKIKDNPETRLNFPDFSRLCGQKWQAMNEMDREIYETKANEVIKSVFTVICGKKVLLIPGIKKHLFRIFALYFYKLLTFSFWSML